MPNQFNYGNPIVSFEHQRMFRLTPDDQSELEIGEKINLFGSNDKQNIEMWFSNPDGSYAGDILLKVTDPDIGLVSVPDTDGQQYEYLIFNLEKIVERIGLKPGRYSVSVSVYQDEVSSADADSKLTLMEISPSRTEVRLRDIDGGLSTELYEFVIPSVPRIYAKALLDQIFARSVGGLEEGEYIDVGTDVTWSSVVLSQILSLYTPNVTERIIQAQATESYRLTLDEILRRTYYYALDSLANDYLDMNVQSDQFRKYIADALDKTLNEMEQREELDPRFDFV